MIHLTARRMDPPELPGFFQLVAAEEGQRFPSGQRCKIKGALTLEDRKQFSLDQIDLLKHMLGTTGVTEVAITAKRISLRCDKQTCRDEDRLQRLLCSFVAETFSVRVG